MKRLSRLVIPLVFGITLLGLYVFVRNNPDLLRFIDPKFMKHQTVRELLLFAAWLPLIFVIVRAIDMISFDVFITRRGHVRAPILLREIVSIVLYAVAIAWAINSILRYKITGFLATGTVVAAVLALALQDTLGNLLAGIALHLEDSYEIGDVIRTGDSIGVVEAVRWRGTRIRTFNNNVLIVPNSLLARERLEVFPRRNLNARILQIGVDYNVPPANVIGVLTQAASNVDGVSRELPCFARVGGFGESSVIYEIKYFTEDYSQRDRIDADIRKAAWYALKRNAISIPFPIRAYQRYSAPSARHHPEPQEITGRLKQIDILSPLSPAAQQSIADAVRVHVYSQGETIIRRGARGDSMFIIHKGTVSVRIDEEVARLGEGDFFGEMALLTGEVRAADVVALEDVVAIEITKEALEPILRDHPDLADAISDRIMERRDTLDSLRAEHAEAERGTVLSRIRAYFGL